MRKLLFVLLVWLYPLFSFGVINEYSPRSHAERGNAYYNLKHSMTI